MRFTFRRQTKLGGLIRKYRYEKGMLQQKELSAAFGLKHPQSVSNWEKGAVYPPPAYFKRLIDMLEIPYEKVLDAVAEDARADAFKLLAGDLFE